MIRGTEMIHRIQIQAGPEGVIILDSLPLEEGETVEIIVITSQRQQPLAEDYPLQGLPVHLDRPFDSVAEAEWGALA